MKYFVHVVKASEIIWGSRSLLDRLGLNPSPFIEISLGEQKVHVTKAKTRTLTPVWNEHFDLKSNDPTSILSINLRDDFLATVTNFVHLSTTPGASSTSIGSTQLSIQYLEELEIFSSGDISLDLFQMGEKTGVVTIRFTREYEPPPAPKPIIPPPELRPDFVPSGKKLQSVGYQSQDVSIEQVGKIVRQILARSSAKNSDTGYV